MESQAKNLSDYLAMFRRYKSRIFAVGITIAVLAIAIAVGLPPLYRSTGTILIEQQEIPQEMVRSTITSFADQRIHVISQRVMTRANLTAIIDKYDLYHKERQDDPMEVILEKMRDSIKMQTVSADVVDPRNGHPTQATIAFTVSYDNNSPALAQKVANELVSLYLNENLKSRTESASEASGFLTEEVNKLKTHITELEAKLAKFKEHNANQLPEFAQTNFQLMDRTERDLIDAQMVLRNLRERKSYLESQLALISQDPSVYTENGERLLGPADRLKQLQVKYLSMVSIYGENHPDLVRTRKEIESLKKEVGTIDSGDELRRKQASVAEQLDEARKKYSSNHPEVKRLEGELVQLGKTLQDTAVVPARQAEETSRNPAYIQLQTQLESANVELAVAEKRELVLRGKLEEYERHLAQMPEVERAYHELVRDYENSTASFKELKAKQTEAQLAQVMENERKGERFTLVEPPELSEKPLKPNRIAILALGVVVSFVGSIGTAAISGTLDTAVYGTGGLAAATEMRPLVTIPYIDIQEDINRRRKWKKRIIMALIALVAIGLFSIHILYMPLDVLWYVVQHRLGFS